jgi:hypothetical protein
VIKRSGNPSNGIKCPTCGSVTDVVETRSVTGGARRRRRCRARGCDGRITTVEVAAPQINGKAFAHGMMAMPGDEVANLAMVPRRALALIHELATLIGVPFDALSVPSPSSRSDDQPVELSNTEPGDATDTTNKTDGARP